MLEIATPQLVTGPQQEALPAHAETLSTFHQILSALNPLQYIPVVGTIYRAVTGDEIPEPLRRVGTLIVSFLMGGPVGAMINVGIFAAEKLTGFDIDKTGQAALHGDLPGDPAGAPGGATAVAGGTPVPMPTAEGAPAQVAGPDLPASLVFASVARPSSPALSPPASPPASAEAWSPAQLAAYGVGTTGDGTLKLADLRGADVLNSLELTRVQMVRTAYDRATNLTH
jgi:hypothetical protein